MQTPYAHHCMSRVGRRQYFSLSGNVIIRELKKYVIRLQPYIRLDSPLEQGPIESTEVASGSGSFTELEVLSFIVGIWLS